MASSMSSITAGMNPDEVRKLGTELKNRGSDLMRIAGELDKRVASTAWVGADANRFKQDWWPQHRQHIVQFARDLEGLGQSAFNNASEQDRASGTKPHGDSRSANGTLPNDGDARHPLPTSPSPERPSADPTPRIHGPQHFANDGIADQAERDIAAGAGQNHGKLGWDQPGECMVAAARWIRGAGGSWPGSPNGPLSAYESAGAASIPMGELARGDVIQRASASSPTSWSDVHTAVILGRNEDGSYRIAESNWNRKGDMRIVEQWRPEANLPKGSVWSGWRFGQ